MVTSADIDIDAPFACAEVVIFAYPARSSIAFSRSINQLIGSYAAALGIHDLLVQRRNLTQVLVGRALRRFEWKNSSRMLTVVNPEETWLNCSVNCCAL